VVARRDPNQALAARENACIAAIFVNRAAAIRHQSNNGAFLLLTNFKPECLIPAPAGQQVNTYAAVAELTKG
jgi:hypothetical protein